MQFGSGHFPAYGQGAPMGLQPAQQSFMMPPPAGLPTLGPNLHGQTSFMEGRHSHGQVPGIGGGPFTFKALPEETSMPPQQSMVPPRAQVPVPVVPVRRGTCQEEFPENQCWAEQEDADDDFNVREKKLWHGLDIEAMKPWALSLSTVAGAVWVLVVEVPLLATFLKIPQTIPLGAFGGLYTLTLVTMMFAGFADPGQLANDDMKSRRALINQDGSSEQADSEAPLPQRAHKNWQYDRPIRRYDHYCKWLANSIGLLNHREFFLMVCCLATIGVVGTATDAVLMLSLFREDHKLMGAGVTAHLFYSMFVIFIAVPIFRTHIGLVSRNELAKEWSKNTNYIVRTSRKGENIPVPDLSDDEHNELFEFFVYDKKKNKWDRGCLKNCFVFWFAPRYSEDALGEF